MAGRILYKASVSRDLKKIAKIDRVRILKQIRELLGSDLGEGETLHGEFAGLWKLRVGDYRVIYSLAGDDVLVLRIRHRRNTY